MARPARNGHQGCRANGQILTTRAASSSDKYDHRRCGDQFAGDTTRSSPTTRGRHDRRRRAVDDDSEGSRRTGSRVSTRSSSAVDEGDRTRGCARRGGFLRLRVTLARERGAIGRQEDRELKVAVPRRKFKRAIGIINVREAQASATTEGEYYGEYAEEEYSTASAASFAARTPQGDDAGGARQRGHRTPQHGRRTTRGRQMHRRATATIVTGTAMVPVMQYGNPPKKRYTTAYDRGPALRMGGGPSPFRSRVTPWRSRVTPGVRGSLWS